MTNDLNLPDFLEKDPETLWYSAANELSTLRDFLRFAVSQFHRAGLFFGHGNDNAWDEAVYLALFSLSLPPQQALDAFLDARLLPKERFLLLRLLRHRVVRRLPAAYLTREAWLCGRRFYVDERVIVPRSFIAAPLCERLAPWIRAPERISRILDLCTGSGCLAILAALYFPEAAVDAADISPDALEVARKNTADYALEGQVRLVESDGFSALEETAYDLILCNPPYVDAASMRALPPEYRHEPALALESGEDGLDFTRYLLEKARARLNPGGLLVVEIGRQRARLEAAFPRLPFTWIDTTDSEETVFLLTREELPVEETGRS